MKTVVTNEVLQAVQDARVNGAPQGVDQVAAMISSLMQPGGAVSKAAEEKHKRVKKRSSSRKAEAAVNKSEPAAAAAECAATAMPRFVSVQRRDGSVVAGIELPGQVLLEHETKEMASLTRLVQSSLKHGDDKSLMDAALALGEWGNEVKHRLAQQNV